MPISSPVYTHVTGQASSSSKFTPLRNDGGDIPEETSPLLRPKRAQRQTVSEWFKSTRSSFLDDNLGLFTVASAEFFVFAMNATVKLLNSSDEPVPILEVREEPQLDILARTNSVICR